MAVHKFKLFITRQTSKGEVLFTKPVDEQINEWIDAAKPASVEYLNLQHVPKTNLNTEYDVVLLRYTPTKSTTAIGIAGSRAVKELTKPVLEKT